MSSDSSLDRSKQSFTLQRVGRYRYFYAARKQNKLNWIRTDRWGHGSGDFYCAKIRREALVAFLLE